MAAWGAVVVIAMAEFADGLVGLTVSEDANIQVLSEGRPEQVRLKVPLKASIESTTIIVLLVVPRVLRRASVSRAVLKMKSGETINDVLVELT